MRTLLSIVLAFFVAQNLFAQQDTLIIKIENYAQLTILSKQLISKQKTEPNFDEIFRKFYNDFKKIDNANSAKKTFNISYIYDKYDDAYRSIKIEKEKVVTDEFLFQDNLTQEIKSFNYTLSIKIYTKGFEEIIIAVNQLDDFDKIAKLSIDTLYKKAQLDLLSRDLNKRMAYKMVYSQEKDHLNIDNTIVKKDKTLDQLNLNASYGMIIMSSNFAPEISLNAEFAIYQKSKTKYIFGVSTTFLFMPDKNDFFKIRTYNLVSVHYNFLNFKNSSHSLGIGYMYRKTGEDFNGDTWSAVWQYKMKHVGVKLGAYFTKNLSGDYVAIPSIGFNFGF